MSYIYIYMCVHMCTCAACQQTPSSKDVLLISLSLFVMCVCPSVQAFCILFWAPYALCRVCVCVFCVLFVYLFTFCVCFYIHMKTYIYIYIYTIYTNAHTHTHAHMHTHISRAANTPLLLRCRSGPRNRACDGAVLRS